MFNCKDFKSIDNPSLKKLLSLRCNRIENFVREEKNNKINYKLIILIILLLVIIIKLMCKKNKKIN